MHGGRTWLLLSRVSAIVAVSVPPRRDRQNLPFNATESKQMLLSKMEVAAQLARNTVWAGPVLAVLVAALVLFAVWVLLASDSGKEQEKQTTESAQSTDARSGRVALAASESAVGVPGAEVVAGAEAARISGVVFGKAEQAHFWPVLAVLTRRVMDNNRLVLAVACFCSSLGAAGTVYLFFVLQGFGAISYPGMASYQAGLHFNSRFPSQAEAAEFVCLLQVEPPGQVLELPGLTELVVSFRSELNSTGRLLDFVSHDTVPASDTSAAVGGFNASDIFRSADGSATLMQFSIKDSFQSNAAVHFAAWSSETFHRLASQVPGLSYHGILSVPDMFDADIQDAEQLIIKLHLVTVPLTAAVLWYVLGSLRLMLVPAVTVGVSAITSLGLFFCWHWVQTLDFITPSLIVAISIAMGTDYSLFILTKFRQELVALHAKAQELSSEEMVRAAVPSTMATAGFTVLSSGLLLMFCLLTLVCFPVPLISVAGVGASIALAATVCANILVVPALLVTFPNFFVKCVPQSAGLSGASQRSSEPSYPTVWKVVARWTTVWPVNMAVVAATLCLAVAVSPALAHMRITNDFKGFMPRGTKAFEAFLRLENTFGRSHAAPFKVMLEPPLGGTVTTQEFWRDSQKVLNALGSTLPSTSKSDILFPSFAKGFPVPWTVHTMCEGQDWRKVSTWLCTTHGYLLNRFTNEQKNAAWGIITPSCDPFAPAGMAWVDQFRRSAQVLTKKTGIKVTLVGPGVTSADVVQETYRAFPYLVAIDLVVVLVLCGIIFKSVWIPLWQSVSIAMTLVTSYSVSALVFQHGALDWLGWKAVSGSLLGVPWSAPVCAFPFLVGLCLDYDVFLLTQVTYLRTLGYDAHDAIRHGVCSSGGIISAAAIIMSITFMSLLTSGMMILDSWAFLMLFAVLYDAFVMRTIVVPALMSFAGRYQWWPGHLFKDRIGKSPAALGQQQLL